MIYVQKLNVVLRIADEKLDEYLGMGYIQLDEKGTCVDPSDNITPTDSTPLEDEPPEVANADDAPQKRTRKSIQD